MQTRKTALETFKETKIPQTPYNWHIWKRAFDVGYKQGQTDEIYNRPI